MRINYNNSVTSVIRARKVRVQTEPKAYIRLQHEAQDEAERMNPWMKLHQFKYNDKRSGKRETIAILEKGYYQPLWKSFLSCEPPRWGVKYLG